MMSAVIHHSIIGAHQNTLENIPLVLVRYICIFISRITDNMIFVAQLLADSSSLYTLRPVVRFGPSLGSLILVGMLRETPKRWVQRIFFMLVLMNIAASVRVVFLGHVIAVG